MNKTTVIASILAALTAGAAAASASSGEVLTGDFWGTVYQNHIDLDGDGSPGRAGELHSLGKFVDLPAYVDVSLGGPKEGCAIPYTLVPAGEITFTSNNGKDVIHAFFDDDQALCPDGSVEVVDFTVDWGDGKYLGATGTGHLSMPDDVVNLFDPSGVPYPWSVTVKNASYRIEID